MNINEKFTKEVSAVSLDEKEVENNLNLRYFFFSFQCYHSNGNVSVGNTAMSYNGFPPMSYIIQTIQRDLKFVDPDLPVIIGWQEFTSLEDYSSFVDNTTDKVIIS